MIPIYTFHIITLGCRVNQYESRVIAQTLSAGGMTESDSPAGCDLCVVNTCAVTAEGSRKSRQMIRRCSAASPDAVIIVTGCYSQISPDEIAALGCTDYICGTGDKLALCERALELLGKKRAHGKPEIVIAPNSEFDSYTLTTPEKIRTYLKIEDGCNGKCAYCIIPAARGPVRSKEPELAYTEARALACAGVKELVVTGIEISGYQYDLCELLDRISGIDGIERIRLGSLDPSMITLELAARFARIPKLMPHFHLSIQSGCSRTLAAMRRKYNAERAMKSITLLRGAFPRVMLTCDLIVGFPGETEDDFAQTLSFLTQARFLHAHIFPYSPRPGTPAAAMPGQLTRAVKEERLKRAEELQGSIVSELLGEVIDSKETFPVLFEVASNGKLTGHSDNFIEVTAEGAPELAGKQALVLPDGQSGGVLTGTII